VLVDDVAGRRGVDRRQHGDEVDAGGGLAADGVEQLVARDRLVGDDEDVAHVVRASSRSATRSPPKTACCAPGTPYSYGPPTTCGISSKLKSGGGEGICHSSVIARHGFGPAAGPCAHDHNML